MPSRVTPEHASTTREGYLGRNIAKLLGFFGFQSYQALTPQPTGSRLRARVAR